MLGWYEEITVNFMIPGYTKFLCDSFYGNIKKLYRNSEVNQINDIEEIIKNSSEGNEPIQYKNAYEYPYDVKFVEGIETPKTWWVGCKQEKNYIQMLSLKIL
ncbi:147_t:CDS:2, partial [Entrophospora sp. SA101]